MKVYDIYHSLTNGEKQDFRNWLIYELNGKHAEVLEFLELRLKKKLSPGETWIALFPNKVYQDQKLRQIGNKLLAKLEIYLAISQFRKDPIGLGVSFLSDLETRNLNQLFGKEHKKIRNRLDKCEAKSLKTYRYVYEMEILQQQHVLKNSNKIDYQREQQLIDSFNTWVIMEKLELTLMQINYEQAIGNRLEDRLMEPFLRTISDKPNALPLLLKLFYQTYLLLTNHLSDDEKKELTSLMKSSVAQINIIILKNLFNLISNYYIRYLNQTDNPKYQRILFDFYQWGIDSQVIFTDGILMINHYKNILTTCISIGLLKDAENYLEILAPYLPQELREETVNYNRANLLFAEGKYSETIKYIYGTKFQSVYFVLAAQAIEARARYEILDINDPQYIEFLESRVQAINRYLKSHNEIPHNHHQSFGVFIQLLQKLLRERDLLKLDKLISKAQEKSPFYAHKWLISKILDKKTTLFPMQEGG